MNFLSCSCHQIHMEYCEPVSCPECSINTTKVVVIVVVMVVVVVIIVEGLVG